MRGFRPADWGFPLPEPPGWSRDGQTTATTNKGIHMKWIEPQSRLIVDGLFKRKFDSFTDEAKRKINWIMLVGDVFAAYVLLSLL